MDQRLKLLYDNYRSGDQKSFPTHLDNDLKPLLRGTRILVTGSGSVGANLALCLLQYPLAELIVADISEYSLLRLSDQIRDLKPSTKVSLRLLDIHSSFGLDDLLQSTRIDIILHTAAYKHLPLLEWNVRRAVEVNLQGTINVIEAARKHGVSRMVFVSTDKAVHPSSVLGRTKLLCENYIRSLYQSSEPEIKIGIARFGNVFGSSGSVVPIIEESLEKQTKLRITDMAAERFFLSSQEANQLILSALLLGQGGETFIFDMEDPIKIVDLAKHISLVHKGINLREDQIELTGLQPGEKLKESCYEQWATVLETPYKKVLLVDQPDISGDFVNLLLSLLRSLPNFQTAKINEELIDLTNQFNTESIE